MFEKRWASVPPQLLTANGTASGVLTVPDSLLFKVKQRVILKSNTQTTQILQVKRITTKTTLEVGPDHQNIHQRSDVSGFLTADSASLSAVEQDRSKIGHEDYDRAVFEEEPANANRSILVDRLGNPIGSDPNNPLQVQLSDGSIDIGTVNAELEVQLSSKDNYPDAGDVHDSVRIGDQNNELLINADGSINTINTGAVADVAWDDLLFTRDLVTQDISVAVYKKDGNTVRTSNFIYDAYENLIEVIKS